MQRRGSNLNHTSRYLRRGDRILLERDYRAADVMIVNFGDRRRVAQFRWTDPYTFRTLLIFDEALPKRLFHVRQALIDFFHGSSRAAIFILD
jgi:hypothetical protein